MMRNYNSGGSGYMLCKVGRREDKSLNDFTREELTELIIMKTQKVSSTDFLIPRIQRPHSISTDLPLKKTVETES